MGDEIYSLLLPLIGVIVIIFLAYISTQWLSKKYNTINSGKYIKVIERTVLGKDTSLVLIEVASKKYLLSVSLQKTEVLLSFESNEIQQTDIKTQDFNSILASVSNCRQFFEKKHSKDEKKINEGKKS